LCVRTPTVFITGNGDREIVARMRGIETGTVPERFRHVMDWTASQLGAKDEAMLSAWPKTLTVDVTGLGKVLFCHATPHNDVDIFTRLTSVEKLAPLFAGIDASVVVCGHTHMQFDRMVGRVRVVNAGSVGLPFAPPGAYWVMLGPAVDLRCTAYDFDAAADMIRKTSYPEAEAFASRDILNPPTEKEMLERFSAVELK
jgi:predicted phosphodiesterase